MYTDGHTDIYYVKTISTSGETKTDISTKIPSLIYFTITILSLQYLCQKAKCWDNLWQIIYTKVFCLFRIFVPLCLSQIMQNVRKKKTRQRWRSVIASSLMFEIKCFLNCFVRLIKFQIASLYIILCWWYVFDESKFRIDLFVEEFIRHGDSHDSLIWIRSV